MVNKVLLKPVKYFEVTFLQSYKNKALSFNLYFDFQGQYHTNFTEFDTPVGSRAINKFLERRIAELAFCARQGRKYSHLAF